MLCFCAHAHATESIKILSVLADLPVASSPLMKVGDSNSQAEQPGLRARIKP